MTTLSTALSLGFMPLNIFLYSQRWTAHKAKIPYDKICLSLVLVIVPVILGAFFKRKWPNAARILIKVSTTKTAASHWHGIHTFYLSDQTKSACMYSSVIAATCTRQVILLTHTTHHD